MSVFLLSFVTLIYAIIAIIETYNGNRGMALVFAGYTLANLGLMIGL